MTSNCSATVIDVVVPLPLDTAFSYRVPAPLVHRVEVGKRVFVPFGRRSLTGYIVAVGQPSQDGEIKDIIDILDEEPLLTDRELDFLRWTAHYYHYPFGEVIKAALPAGINVETRRRTTSDGSRKDEIVGGRRARTALYFEAVSPLPEHLPVRGKALDILNLLRESGEMSAVMLRERFKEIAPQLKKLEAHGLVMRHEREVYRDPFRDEFFGRDEALPLNRWQSEAFSAIVGAAERGAFTPFLLHGVTGSGKTEVYLQAIAEVLRMGKTALVLVPEISLTPQLVHRFKRRFSCGIAVFHSGLSDGERFDEWRRTRRGEVSIVIGARSAIFAPLNRIGIIVVDEEHEDSYKQAEGLRYHARDLALVRGKREAAVVVLGSATPLISTYHAAKAGKIGYLSLPQRVRDLPLPQVEVADARLHKKELLSSRLIEALAGNLEKGEQSLLFLNRRGFATFLICRDCGHVLSCPNCSVTLTYHRGLERHYCHYCDYSIPAPSVCPGCSGPEVGLLGFGTERLEAEVKERFPQARLARMDRDTTGGKGAHARILKEVEQRRVDILIGTQMVAKGHDFPGVTLVGVVSADATLNLPDYRGAERGFQLMSQVLGRAGRGGAPGRVIIQTFNPEHYAVQRAASHDYEGFYDDETSFRNETGYPPFAFLAGLHFSGNSAQEVERGATAAAVLLRSLRAQAGRVEVLGPCVSPLAKIRGKYRWQILLKGASRQELHRIVAVCRKNLKLPAVVRLSIDMDPVDML